MNILILNWRDTKHPLGGGAEISLLEHAKYWVRQGATVTWFTSSYPGSKETEIVDGIRMIRKGSTFTVHLHAAIYYLLYLRKSVDIIFDNFHFFPFFTPFYIKKKPIVAFINEPARESWFKNINVIVGAIGYFLEPLFFIPYKNTLLLTGSKSIAQELLKYNIKKEMIRVIPHGIQLVNLKKIPKKSSHPVIIYLAQISPDKGIEDALAMFHLIKQEIPKAMFWIVGKAVSKKYLQKIKTTIAKLPENLDIEMFGFVSEFKKQQLLEKAWILVHPSMREGWGLNVIEANNFGTPAVGYNISGLRDSIRDQKTGILTKENNPKSLAEEIISLLQDKKKYATLSQHAGLFAKNFSWEESGKRSWKILENAYESYAKE